MATPPQAATGRIGPTLWRGPVAVERSTGRPTRQPKTGRAQSQGQPAQARGVPTEGCLGPAEWLDPIAGEPSRGQVDRAGSGPVSSGSGRDCPNRPKAAPSPGLEENLSRATNTLARGYFPTPLPFVVFRPSSRRKERKSLGRIQGGSNHIHGGRRSSAISCAASIRGRISAQSAPLTITSGTSGRVL